MNPKAKKKSVNKDREKPEPTDYSGISTPRKKRPDIVSLTRKYKDGRPSDEDAEVDPDAPRVITEDEFNDGSFTKRSFDYYMEDDVLVDEDETVISEPEKFLGDRALLSFDGKKSNDPDIVYVRNEQLRIDYEVCQKHDTYTHGVLGVEDDETPPKKRKGKKPNEASTD